MDYENSFFVPSLLSPSLPVPAFCQMWQQTAFPAQRSSAYNLHTKQPWVFQIEQKAPIFSRLYKKYSQGWWVRLLFNCYAVNKVVNQTIFKQRKTLHFFRLACLINTLSNSFLSPSSLKKKNTSSFEEEESTWEMSWLHSEVENEIKLRFMAKKG